MSNSNLALYGFMPCPYMERVKIFLAEKNIAHEFTLLDKKQKPEWFLKISPTGRAPVLKIGETVLFESAVISEYLNDINGNPFLPQDDLMKAHNRAWIAYAGEVNAANYFFVYAKDAAERQNRQQTIFSKLDYLNQQLQQQPYFNGEAYSLVDMAYTPAFTRLSYFKECLNIDFLEKFTNIKRWSEELLKRDSAKALYDKSYKAAFIELIKPEKS